MMPRYLQKRPSKAKAFSQTSMTIPGLALDIRTAYYVSQRCEPYRSHSSGSYDPDLNDPSKVSPFQRGFELTDFASTKYEAASLIKDFEQQHNAKRKNVDAGASVIGRKAEEPAPQPAEPATT